MLLVLLLAVWPVSAAVWPFCRASYPSCDVVLQRRQAVPRLLPRATKRRTTQTSTTRRCWRKRRSEITRTARTGGSLRRRMTTGAQRGPPRSRQRSMPGEPQPQRVAFSPCKCVPCCAVPCCAPVRRGVVASGRWRWGPAGVAQERKRAMESLVRQFSGRGEGVRWDGIECGATRAAVWLCASGL